MILAIIGVLAGNESYHLTLQYVAAFQHWRLWLLEAKQTLPLGRPADLVDYLLARRDEVCGKSIPSRSRYAGWRRSQSSWQKSRVIHGRLASATKDRIVESLFFWGIADEESPKLPCGYLGTARELVMNDMIAVGWRVWAWLELVNWSDVQAILPSELRMARSGCC